MKIINVETGLIKIPPNGWGAIEKIIWNYDVTYKSRGIESKICFLDDVDYELGDIVHIHLADLALLAFKRGIPYYLTVHDHHVYLYGKDSKVYKEYKLAIKNSIKTFVPAKYLVDYFDEPNVYYVPHGTDINFYRRDFNIKREKNTILCVANNGMAGDSSRDRKGFLLALEAAKILKYKITFAGPKHIESFFDLNHIPKEDLNIFCDLDDEGIRDLYRKNEYFLNPSELEAGHPNLTLLEAASCGCKVLTTKEKDSSVNFAYEIERDVISILRAIEYSKKVDLKFNKDKWSWQTVCNILLDHFYYYSDFKKILIESYTKEYKATVDFNDGAKVTLKPTFTESYALMFINKQNGKCELFKNLKGETTIKSFKKYFVDWKILGYKESGEIYFFDYELDLKGKDVLILFDSSALGDTIAWWSSLEDFKNKHKCNLYVFSFITDIFENKYSFYIFKNFEELRTCGINFYATYKLGWFLSDNKEGYSLERHPVDMKRSPLQKNSYDILGLDYDSSKDFPVNVNFYEFKHSRKYVCIATNSTAQCKYWNNDKGWQEICNYFVSKNIDVFILGKEGDGYMGNYFPVVKGKKKGKIIKIQETNLVKLGGIIKSSYLFIGLPSGLSWLAWCVHKKPIILISGFSMPYTEMQSNVVRIFPTNPKICSGCFNRVKFNPGDWMWCPDHKDTERQFECTKSITSDQVILEIKKLEDSYLHGS